MSNVEIKYLGWIEDDSKWASLTWSSTLMKVDLIDNVKILFDYWMFQWWNNEAELNKKTDEEAIKADFIVITHAHMDHIWRLPLLVKKWFKWRIIMSNITKQLAWVMLNDYVKLTKKLIEDKENKNKTNWNKYRKSIKIVGLIEELLKNNLDKETKKSKQKELYSSILNNNWLNKIVDQEWFNIEEIVNKDNTYETTKQFKTLKVYEENSDLKNVKTFKVKIIESILNDKRDTNLNISLIKEVLKFYKNDLNEKGINYQSDIENTKNENEIELLYDVDDIYKTLSLVETLEVWSEIDLDKRLFIKSPDDHRIDWILDKIKKGNQKNVYVLPHLKQFIIDKWEKEYKNVINLTKKNKEIKKSLYKAFDFVKNPRKDIVFPEWEDFDSYLSKQIKLLSDYKIVSKKDINDIHFFELYELSKKLKLDLDFVNSYEEILEKDINLDWEEYGNKKTILDEYGIKDFDDIDRLIEEKKSEYELNFTKKDIDNAKKYLIPVFDKPNQKVVESFKLRFINAWHIEWSVQALISLVTRKVDNAIWTTWNHLILNDRIKKEYKNFLFSWDLWKFTDENISWIPDFPSFKLDYVQCETTYAWREHPNKAKEFTRFISEINSAKWKVLIPAFSLQRTQEIIMELLQNKKENLDKIKRFWVIKKRYKVILKLYKDLNREELSKEEHTKKIELFKEKSSIEKEMKEISESVLLHWILTDSPLWDKVTQIFNINLPEKYDLLDKWMQKKIFWKEVIRNLIKWEYKDLYKDNRKKSKDVIISSWWMCQWWAIINHLKEIVSDSNAKIIFTGYQAKNTIWWKLVNWDKKVYIEWVEYDVKCNIVQVKWYSSHIWWEDIKSYLLDMLNYTKNAVVSLTHWWEDRKELEKSIIESNKKVKVIVPYLDENVNIDL